MPIAVSGPFVTPGSRLSNALSIFFYFWPRGLTPGSKFTKLGGGLHQAPIRYPAKFQADRTNGLRRALL